MSGWNHDPERCADRDKHFASTVVYDGLRLCGCGNPDAVLAEVLNALRACPLYERRWQPSPDLGPLGAELLLHVIDSADLIDHGTSIHGSWITPKGERFLSVMDGHDLDWLTGSGYSCSACPEAEQRP